MTSTAVDVTYRNTVRSFDHGRFAQLPSYPRLRRALSNFANEAGELVDGALVSELLDIVRDAALSAPYADCCERCDRQNHDLPSAWPHAISREGDWLRCAYVCSQCQYVWTCGYAVNAHLY